MSRVICCIGVSRYWMEFGRTTVGGRNDDDAVDILDDNDQELKFPFAHAFLMNE